MVDVTGAVHHDFGGKTYCLRLTLAGLAVLQDKYGADIGGLLSKDGIQGVPPFGLLIDVVCEALVKGERLPRSEAFDIADDIVTADQGVVTSILNAAFPGARGNAPAPGKRRR